MLMHFATTVRDITSFFWNILPQISEILHLAKVSPFPHKVLKIPIICLSPLRSKSQLLYLRNCFNIDRYEDFSGALLTCNVQTGLSADDGSKRV